MISLYCQICGGPFEAEDYAQRFCSRGCRNRFNDMRNTQTHPLGRRQRAILDILRAQAPGWVSQSAIARSLYSSDDVDDRRAAYLAIWRLRHIWGARGVVIEHRMDHPPFQPGESYYRLVHDVEQPAAVAS